MIDETLISKISKSLLSKHPIYGQCYHSTDADLYQEISAWLSEHHGRTEKPDPDEVQEIYERIKSILDYSEAGRKQRKAENEAYWEREGIDPKFIH